MKFTIVTPVRNGMPMLKGCVESVRDQADGLDIEHLVHDACSTDGTTGWLAEQPGVSARSEPDDGMYDALNRGFAEASGEILGWLNSDEQYLPGTLETVSAYFAAHPEVDAVFGDYLACDPNGRLLSARREIPARRWYLVHGVLYVMSCTFFFRRSLYERTGPFDASLRYAGDKDWILRAVLSGARFRHLRRFLAVFVASGRNLSLEPEAREEYGLVRVRYGTCRHAVLRLVPRACRWLEKAVRGCYLPRRVQYTFRDPEHGTRVLCRRAGPLWRWRSNARDSERSDT